ncbi:hypothetical protein C8F01DRAFT_1121293 [Mycena amicta]|nr:hypothetical protein C8F01DRAFT_1121293 [Mycena amicta]
MPGRPVNMPNVNQAVPIDTDIVFVHDATGSQQPYLTSARNYTRARVTAVKKNLKPGATARFRVIAFRDHREQGDAWTVHDSNGFTDDVNMLERQLGELVASGGGDGPEAQLDALDAAARSSWRKNVNRVVFLITDSPPHGVEMGDKIPASHPTAINAASIRKKFLDPTQKIRLYVVGCVPEIKSYKEAVNFYTDMAQATLGDFIPLANPTKDSGPMDRAIVGAVLHATDSLRIENRWEDWIVGNAQRGHEDLVSDMHAKLSSEGEHCHEVVCTEHGGHDVKYHSAPVSRARVDAIVGKTLKANLDTIHKNDDLTDLLFG